MSSDDIGAAFDKLDRLLEVAQEAGPSIALLLEPDAKPSSHAFQIIFRDL